MTKVERALEALVSPDALSADEQELYFKKLGERYRTSSQKEVEFFTDLQARGGAVGVDELGNIVTSSAG